MKLVCGRPLDISDRLEKEIAVYDFLDNLCIDYQRVDHNEATTMEECEKIDKTLEATICKNLFLCNRQETAFYLLMIPGGKKFKTKDISKQIGSARLSFANEEYMLKFLNTTPGSASIMGLMFDKENTVKLLMDEDVLKGDYIGFHPCINTSSIRVKTSDLVEKIIPALNHTLQIVTLIPEE